MEETVEPTEPDEDPRDPADALRLRTEIHPDGSGLTVIAEGAIDLFTAPLLSRCLSDAADRVSDTGGELVVDLRGVTFIDSAGLGTLIGGHRATHRHFALLMAADGQVAQLLRATRLDNHLNVRIVE